MFDKVTLKLNVDPLILGALKEDITSEDVSTNSVMPEPKLGEVELICKQDGIICGLQVFARTFELLDEDVEITFFAKDGDEVKKGQKMAVVRGDIRVLLCGERTALNYLQRMSGSTFNFKVTLSNISFLHFYIIMRNSSSGFLHRLYLPLQSFY
jgi:nicotinate-nucleotide pyrophosphorylase (carboxylating)